MSCATEESVTGCLDGRHIFLSMSGCGRLCSTGRQTLKICFREKSSYTIDAWGCQDTWQVRSTTQPHEHRTSDVHRNAADSANRPWGRPDWSTDLYATSFLHRFT
eukprot:2441094-Prymnesium_polylepis.1